MSENKWVWIKLKWESKQWDKARVGKSLHLSDNVTQGDTMGCCSARFLSSPSWCISASASPYEQQGGREEACGVCVCVCVVVCLCVCVCVCAQVADTLGKSFQIHLFRSLCADDTCKTLPKKCHGVSDFVCSYDPPSPQLACVRACVRMCLCVSMYILCLYLSLFIYFSGRILRLYVGRSVKCLIQNEK